MYFGDFYIAHPSRPEWVFIITNECRVIFIFYLTWVFNLCHASSPFFIIDVFL
ncbi:hypothetical protein YPPY66_3991 [Yersinia pestis PY-66]|uniref:Uncharacterized protein n=1 Tax=Yersinia pestis PY-08 TaxID=992134 RepID=A0AB72ZLD3_YERPE|nr:hypothetical protein YpB42003004_3410 [Yersinia pestis biovar Antiqua str. B42003004]EIQ85797.1 hypothetical protein YPPY01_3616 [Yersinia pestis PY-01]EIQ86046.1 hypothetical protein YPPY02_3667 [Yersinia pestis PY-02]EIR00083.1 hypothetical protein YPPY05_3656 [Yersinia pestis PY-05]EIR14353.1 hypothetical protein YPPY07_3584 [Yersinia pestis PY-07]EIR15130.1 hypothetical protein YPPY08_3708 [Yersinia pestis PY-08]EIR16789.1 hypothetical protein YPPY09_3716 [Yersinia pestis PY-09]EIR298